MVFLGRSMTVDTAVHFDPAGGFDALIAVETSNVSLGFGPFTVDPNSLTIDVDSRRNPLARFAVDGDVTINGIGTVTVSGNVATDIYCAGPAIMTVGTSSAPAVTMLDNATITNNSPV